MNNFSTRMGLEYPLPIQKDSMNTALRNRLWNAIKGFLDQGIIRTPYTWNRQTRFFIYCLWDEFFKLTSESITENPYQDIANIKEVFDSYSWNKIYDFLEFIASKAEGFVYHQFIEKCNNILEEENSAYRFHDQMIIEVISDIEMKSIDTAIQVPINTVSSHLKKSVKLLFDRNKPDYENSIKEAVSGIEALVRNITGSDQSLSDLLKSKTYIILDSHPVIKEVISKLYAYAGDKSGIRHSNKNNHIEAKKEEAIFILVTSSAIINYVNSNTK